MAFPTALLALLIELAFGYPERLFKAIGHPVTWIGWLIARLEAMLHHCLLYTSPSPRDRTRSRMPSSA